MPYVHSPTFFSHLDEPFAQEMLLSELKISSSFRELLRASMIFFDNITFAILLWNFGVLGLISIHWRSPLILQQAYLIFNSVQMALIFLKFLPKWTCWVLLGALAVWGKVVICPLNMLNFLWFDTITFS